MYQIRKLRWLSRDLTHLPKKKGGNNMNLQNHEDVFYAKYNRLPDGRILRARDIGKKVFRIIKKKKETM